VRFEGRIENLKHGLRGKRENVGREQIFEGRAVLSSGSDLIYMPQPRKEMGWNSVGVQKHGRSGRSPGENESGSQKKRGGMGSQDKTRGEN